MSPDQAENYTRVTVGYDEAALVDLSHDLDLSAVVFRLAHLW